MSNSFDALKIQDFDHLEFAVQNLDEAAKLYLRFGFEKAATREILERKLKSYLMVQNNVAIVLSHSALSTDPIAKFVATHGDGVFSVAFRCDDAVSALEVAVNRGAKRAEAPRAYQRNGGAVQQASIHTFGDVRHTFISRTGGIFAEGFDNPVKAQNRGFGLERIDHITSNVSKGDRVTWTKFYEDVFGLQNVRFFDIHTARTGLYSTVMMSPNGVIKMPFNEPTEDASQIQEFLDINHGPGIQHVAIQTGDICSTLRPLRKEGIRFLEVPPTYYEAIPGRVPNVSESLSTLAELGILVDGDSKGYLLQIFTENLVGPFFYEVIQRKGNDGFGEGNFTALFEAIERDQIRRGVLKA